MEEDEQNPGQVTGVAVETRRERLFPGRHPGRRMVREVFRSKLVAHGIRPGHSRHAAMFALAGDVPSPVLAELIGIADKTATKWAALAARQLPAVVVRINGVMPAPGEFPKERRLPSARHAGDEDARHDTRLRSSGPCSPSVKRLPSPPEDTNISPPFAPYEYEPCTNRELHINAGRWLYVAVPVTDCTAHASFRRATGPRRSHD